MRSDITMSKGRSDDGPLVFQMGWNCQRAIEEIILDQGHWWEYLLAICMVGFAQNRTHLVINDTDTADVAVVTAVPSSFILYQFPSPFSFAVLQGYCLYCQRFQRTPKKPSLAKTMHLHLIVVSGITTVSLLEAQLNSNTATAKMIRLTWRWLTMTMELVKERVWEMVKWGDCLQS